MIKTQQANGRWLRMSAAGLLLAASHQALAADTPATLALDWLDAPTLQATGEPGLVVYTTTDGAFPPTRCAQLRAATTGELSAPWHDIAQAPRVDTCTVDAPTSANATPFLQYEASSRLKPGSVTLQGLPVLAVHTGMGPNYGQVRYTLGVPFAQASAALQATAAAACQARLAGVADAAGYCIVQPLEADAGSGWTIRFGEPNASVSLLPAPDTLLHSLYSQNWSD